MMAISWLAANIIGLEAIVFTAVILLAIMKTVIADIREMFF